LPPSVNQIKKKKRKKKSMAKPGEPIHAPLLLAGDASSPDRRDPVARLWIRSPAAGSSRTPSDRAARCREPATRCRICELKGGEGRSAAMDLSTVEGERPRALAAPATDADDVGVPRRLRVGEGVARARRSSKPVVSWLRLLVHAPAASSTCTAGTHPTNPTSSTRTAPPRGRATAPPRP